MKSLISSSLFMSLLYPTLKMDVLSVRGKIQERLQIGGLK